MNKRVLVVDLDGTLYSINTFHFFIKYLLLFGVKKLKVVLFAMIVVIVSMRLLRLISHSQMKYKILLNIKNRTDIDYKAFVDRLNKHKHSLHSLNKNEYDIKILATAAPSCYANIIANNNNFDYCSATNFPEGRYSSDFENIKEVKKINVMKILNDQHILKIEAIITDHLDDLPLMKVSNHVIIVNPSNELIKQLSGHNIQFKIERH